VAARLAEEGGEPMTDPLFDGAAAPDATEAAGVPDASGTPIGRENHRADP